MSRAAIPLLLAGGTLLGCASGGPEPAPQPAAAPAPAPTETVSADELRQLEGTLAGERERLAEARAESERLREQLEQKEAAIASLEERYAALELELATTLEEVLRSKASVRGVHSRALATSRISEVRVQLESVTNPADPEVAARLERAEDLLAQADAALGEENFGGASYLAERASALVLQARMVGEVRSAASGEADQVIPVVPPRPLAVLANSNLRRGPSLEADRVGGVNEGASVTALARSGEWYQVETEGGLVAWIHGRLVR